MDDDASSLLPRPFGPYLLLARLARGGMGEVFLAKHGGLQGFEKYCVVKTLRAELAQQDEYMKRFTEEARVVVQLSHRNVCSVFDVGRAQGQLYVAMEHIVSRDLRVLSASTQVSPAIAVHVVAEVLEALDYAHRHVDADTEQPLALVHRDVSPHNVLIGAEGDVKLIDFGIATTSRIGPVTDDGTVLGKLTYMSPEHARGDPVDGRSDEYSAAVMLTELLTGAPFNVDLTREQTWQIAGIGGHRPKAFASLDAELRAVLDRALDPLPERRWATCTDFADAVVSWARRHGHVADARDLRRLMTAVFPGLAVETRGLVRSFHEVRAPSFDDVANTPGFETIATTMMAPPTTSTGQAGAGAGTSPGLARGRLRMGPAGILSEPVSTQVLPSTQAGKGDRTTREEVTSSRAAPSSRASSRFALAAGLVVAVVGVVVGVFGGFVIARGGADAGADDDIVVASLPDEPIADATEPAAPIEEPPPPPAPPVPPAEVAVASEPPPPPPEPPPPASRRSSSSSRGGGARVDAETRRTLQFLQSCTSVVPCAPGILEWSRRRLSENERAQLADSAADCAHKCKLKKM